MYFHTKMAMPGLQQYSLKLRLINRDSELGTFECWISGLMLDPLFFLISRLNYAYSPLVSNLQFN